MANNPGPFFFAWVDPETDFDPVAHRVNDEVIASIQIDQSEGDFAALDLTVRNPRIGLLNPGRQVWAWLSWDANWHRTGTPVPDMRPLFYGRLVGIPEGIISERVTLSFIARPLDFAEQKAAVAASLKVLPYYDPVFLTPEAQVDPDSVLETRSELWHIDRTTLEVSTSDILTGEDGLEEFQESEVPYDSVQISVGQVPSRSIAVTARVHWSQKSSGAMDLGRFDFSTYAGASLMDGWPKTGDTLDGGWRVTLGEVKDNYGIGDVELTPFSIQWQNTESKHATGDTMSSSISSSLALLTGPAISTELTYGSKQGESEASINSTTLKIPLWAITARLQLAYDASRDRTETVTFTLRANFQSLITLPDDTDVKTLDVNGGDVGEGGQIVDPGRRSYFTTDRGRRSLEYCVLRARAELLLASRAIEVTFNCKFDRAIELSCRKSARLHDHRIPGGVATGKITKYTIKLDGSDGLPISTVTIGCPIGYGGTVVPDAGMPDYVEDDYVEHAYQVHENEIVVLPASDVGYTVPIDDPDDDGLVFPLRGKEGLKSITTHGSLEDQEAGIDGLITPPQSLSYTAADLDRLVNRATEVPKQIEAFLKTNPIWLEIKLKNLNAGPFDDIFLVGVTDLEMPQGINLEAASTP